MPFLAHRVAVILLVLSFCACGRPPAENSSDSSDSQKLPFDRQPRATGISPSQSVIPSATKLPEGTPIPIRLQSALSSASSHAGDIFHAIVDEPIVIDGQTVVASGTSATGRVLEAKPSTRSGGNSPDNTQDSPEPGYLRIVLVRLEVGGRSVAIETSSIFAKGVLRKERKPAAGSSSGVRRAESGPNRDVEFGVDRHLNFRLAQAVDLQ
ncbi:MAG: hypothetical protein WBQ43_20145 [Terriglobales bacterium]